MTVCCQLSALIAPGGSASCYTSRSITTILTPADWSNLLSVLHTVSPGWLALHPEPGLWNSTVIGVGSPRHSP
jgi:hypothetical protein